MKTWLITGCSSGLGRALAEEVLRRGDCAAVTARRPETVADFRERYPDRALILRLDVRDRNQIEEAVRETVQRFGRIDVLVNNAGYAYRGALEEADEAAIRDNYETLLFGPVRLMKAVIPDMRKRRSGTIVNISSVSAVFANAGSGFYASGKAALDLLSEGVEKELAPLGIRLLIVEPGAFRTNFRTTGLVDAETKIPDYADTAGRMRREYLEKAGKASGQRGDPAKGAAAICDTLEKDRLPLRLVIGADAVKRIRDVFDERLAELSGWEEVSGSTDFE